MTDVGRENPPGSRGWWIDEQRIALGKSWDDLAKEVGIRRQSLHPIRKGGGMHRKTKRRLEMALLWAEGSLDEIDGGGEPTPLSPERREMLVNLYDKKLRDEVEREMWTFDEVSEDRRWHHIFKRRERMLKQGKL